MLKFSRRTALVAMASLPAMAGSTFAAEPPLKIGWIAPLTGPFSVTAAALTFAIKSEVDKINAEGGLLGRQITLIVRDSAGDPAKAVSVVNELIFNEKVDVILGPGSSGEAFPIMDIVAGAKKMHIAPNNADPLIDVVKRPYAFRSIPTIGQQATRTVQFTNDTLKTKKVAIFADSTGYGAVTIDLLKSEYDKTGVKPLVVTPINTNKADVTPEVMKAKEAGADVVQVWTNATGLAARILNARGALGWDVPVVGHTNLVGAEVRGLVDKPEYLKAIYGITYSNTVYDDTGKLAPRAQEFIDRTGKSIEPFMGAGLYVPLLGSATVQIYELGVKKANSFDAAKVAAALETMGTIVTSFGNFTYSATSHSGFAPESLEFVAAGSDRGYGNSRLKLP
jgi:branched-chain amino acid transport system substrate-binding protein